MMSLRTETLLPTPRLHDEMNRIFANFFRDAPLPRVVEGRSPAFNAWEEEDRYVVEAEIPGLKAEDIEISAEGHYLSISGRWSSEREEKSEDGESAATAVKFLRRERASGSFRRRITLPDEVDADRVEAELKHGVLTLTLPKVAEEKPKKIEVQTK